MYLIKEERIPFFIIIIKKTFIGFIPNLKIIDEKKYKLINIKYKSFILNFFKKINY